MSDLTFSDFDGVTPGDPHDIKYGVRCNADGTVDAWRMLPDGTVEWSRVEFEWAAPSIDGSMSDDPAFDAEAERRFDEALRRNDGSMP